MFTAKNYVLVKDMEEAYILNQKKNNVIIGGMLWLKMGNRNIQNAIDLSNLGLNTIIETEETFEIGCMATLRDLELHSSLNLFFNGAIGKSLKAIVGVQFRNLATVGGTIYGRYGFSDLITCLLSINTYVELYKKGIIPLRDFFNMPLDNDILVKIIVHKDGRKVSYLSHRNSASDLPVLTCAVSKTDSKWLIAIGARPSKAKLIIDEEYIVSEKPTDDEIELILRKIAGDMRFDTNMRGSAEYRLHLAKVLTKRGIKEIIKEME